MKKTYSFVIIGIILAFAVASLLLLGSTSTQQPITTREYGTTTPNEPSTRTPTTPPREPSTAAATDELLFKTVDGRTLTIKELLADGKPLLIYFFAAWCPTCKADLQNLNQVYPHYKDKLNIIVIGFDPTETRGQIENYRAKAGYTWPFAEYNREAILKYKVVTRQPSWGSLPMEPSSLTRVTA